MSDPLVFLMGKFEAHFPTDLLYAKNHMWARQESDQIYRFGLSAYAVRLLQDVYFLEWDFDPPQQVRARQSIGQIESSKAESELFSPVAGTFTEFNTALLEDPSAINTDKYGKGWLFTLTTEEPALLTPEEYLEHLAASWEVAQRTIKGQIN